MESTSPDPLARLAERLGPDGRLRVTIEGESMCPALEPGDRVVVEPLSGRLPEPGEVVVIHGKGKRPAAHRVIARQRRLGGWLIATKGDAMPRLDAVVGESDVLGRVVAVERRGDPLPVAGQRAGLWCRLRAHWELLLHGKVGEGHPLRSAPRALGRLLRAARRRPQADPQPGTYGAVEGDREGAEPPERTTSNTT